jgi:hypothetical protein
MNPGVKLMGMIESLMPLTANKTGWVLVESSASPVASVLIYGDKQAIPNRIAALSGTVPSVALNNSRFEVTAQWWTGVSVVNPSETTTANLTLRARKQDGTLIDEISQSLAPLNKVVGLVGSTLFDLSGATEGWVEVISDSPVTGFEMLNVDDEANSHWGLAAIEAQETAATLSLAHFIKNSRWWTLFWLSNPQSTIVDGNSLFYDNQGVLLKDELFSIPAKGQQGG